MMCDVCNGYPGCPVCSEEPYYVECPNCYGVGYFFYTETGEEKTRDDFCNGLLDEIEKVKCERCDGEGEIIDDDDRLE